MKDSNYTKSIIVNSFKELMQKKSFDLCIDNVLASLLTSFQIFLTHYNTILFLLQTFVLIKCKNKTCDV